MNWIQLAKFAIDNTPRVRTVVIRGWNKSYAMNITTDKRSSKFHELESNNNVEICWLFSKSKCQFRFRGKSVIDRSNDTLLKWNKMEYKAQEMWSWPNPGEKYKAKQKNINLSKCAFDKKDNFNLLNIFYIDQLLLNDSIHIRKRWIRNNEWTEERVNP